MIFSYLKINSFKKELENLVETYCFIHIYIHVQFVQLHAKWK